MSHYEYVLETVSEVDAVLRDKVAQRDACSIPAQREIVADQIDTLLELRLKLGQITVEESTL